MGVDTDANGQLSHCGVDLADERASARRLDSIDGRRNTAGCQSAGDNLLFDTCEYLNQFSRVIDDEQEKGEDREKSDEQPKEICFLLICWLLRQMIHHGIDA
ncbi:MULTISPECIES: hypothetical protein [unclassified Janthinobacterium]|uniref:hypothetical protein n=1 Tax=unclassified Janthinobacterium TaxID=2610881 RepID=UPI00161DE1A8|nr:MULTISPECIES: hypothetical protein [unclassified Janthinobacterium]MBB5370975.1 hypothetical protein [Janthinobacterium sp. K2C7]MBB5383781.1 hypothetical protein [Janthinobacterium sp. K2Li3]MBB5388286.1 hypothetical protein [Janthinobacterium sp. K2E3]